MMPKLSHESLEATLDRLAALLDPGEETILWIGAGASIPAGHPSTNQLLEVLRKKAAPDGELPEGMGFTATVDAFVEGVGEGPLSDALQGVFAGDRQPTMVHRALARLAKAGCFSAIISTNYDNLLERALDDAGVPPLLQIREDNIHVLEQDSIRVLKPHGDRGNWSEAVLSGESYRKFEEESAKLVEQLDGLLRKHPVFFVGYSMTDPRTLGWLQELGPERRSLKRWRPLLTEAAWQHAVEEGDEALSHPPTKALIIESYEEHLPKLLTDLADHYDPPRGEGLVLEIVPGDKRWTASFSGGASWDFEDPVPTGGPFAEKLELLRKLDHQPLPTNESGHLEGDGVVAAAQIRKLATDIGDHLSSTCFSAPAREKVEVALRHAREAHPALLRVKVFPETDGDPAEAERRADRALALPWELLRAEGRFPVEDGRLDILREAADESLLGLDTSPTEPLKVVATVAAPENATALDYEAECYRLYQALGEEDKRLKLTDRGTLHDFVRSIETERPPVIHFTGHGRPGKLSFENDWALHDEVSVDELVRRLRLRSGDQPLPRLLYLACCHGATGSSVVKSGPGTRTPRLDPAATTATAPSTAASLHRAGFPQVVAYFGPVGDQQSTRIEAAFYRALVRGETARLALRRAREVSVQPHLEGGVPHVFPLGWAQTVLYHRGEDLPTALVSGADLESKVSWQAPERTIQRLDKEGGEKGVLRLHHGFIGRRSERAKLLHRWHEGERMSVVAGLGGLGKTALCTEVLPILAGYLTGDRSHEASVLALDARGTKDEDDPIPKLWEELQAFQPENESFDPAEWGKGLATLQENGITGRVLADAAFLAAELSGGLLLYIDDAESLQQPIGEGRQIGHWRTEELVAFWARLGELVNEAPGRKVPFGVLASARYVPSGHPDRQTQHLSPMRGADLLRLLRWFPTLARLPHGDRKWLADRIDGHPRTVEFLEDLVRRRLDHDLAEEKGPGFEPSKEEWRPLVLEPSLGEVEDRVSADLLLPRLWEALDEDEREHLGRCLAVISPVPREAVCALGSGKTMLSLVRAGLISPAPSPIPKEEWWAPHRIVTKMVRGRWSGRVEDAHLILGRHFAEAAEGSKTWLEDMFAIEHLSLAGDGSQAWPFAQEHVLSLRSAGRYREALRWVEKVLDGKPQGHARGMALAFRSQFAIYSGVSVDGMEEDLKEALELVQKEEKPFVLDGLGQLMDRLGRLSEAVEYKSQSLTMEAETQGEEHPETLAKMNNLAFTLQAQGDLDGARRLHEKKLGICERIQGEEHPSTLTSMNNLAQTLKAQGDLDGARKLQEKVLEVRKRILGEEHPDTLTSMNNLAGTLQAQGDLDGARKLQEKVLEVRKRILGEEHPSTLTSMNNLAQTLSAEGDLDGARKLEEKVLGVFQRILGEEHPDTLTSMNNLAGTLYAQGDLVGARPFYLSCLRGLGRVLGPQHPNFQTTAGNYLGLLQKLYPKEGQEALIERLKSDLQGDS